MISIEKTLKIREKENMAIHRVIIQKYGWMVECGERIKPISGQKKIKGPLSKLQAE